MAELQNSNVKDEIVEVDFSDLRDERFPEAEILTRRAEQLVQTNERLGKIYDLTATDEFRTNMTEADQRVVEASVNSLMDSVGEPGTLAFEEYYTPTQKTKSLSMALESIQDAFERVCKLIAEVFRKISNWVKKFLGHFKFITDALKRTAKVRKVQSQEAMRAGKKQDPEKAEVPVPNYIAKTLIVGSEVPTGMKLVQSLSQHIETMKKMYSILNAFDKEVGDLMDNAVRRLSSDGEHFQKAVNDCQSLVAKSWITQKTHTVGHKEIPNTMAVFEEPLVFGNQSYYRTGVVSQTELKAEYLWSKVGPNSSYDERAMNGNLTMALSDPQVVEYLSDHLLSYTAVRDKFLSEQQRMSDKFDQIARAMENVGRGGLKDSSDKAKRTMRRAQLVQHVVTMYVKMRITGINDLVVYDNSVLKAIDQYSAASLKNLSKEVEKTT